MVDTTELFNKDWENMVLFALRLIRHSSEHRSDDIVDQRIMIHNLDHALELLIKAYLLKNNYIVNYLEKSDLKEGIKEEEFLSKSKSMDYVDALRLVSKKLNFIKSEQDKILAFHKLRNEIQHRATYLPVNKVTEIIMVYPSMKKLYLKMFEDIVDRFPFPERF